MIDTKKSKRYESLYQKGEADVVVGCLGDAEIIFLHYDDPNETKNKWTRRVERINRENMIVKFSYQNEATDDHVDRFMKLDFKKKFLL